jgi:BlaI family transcriptional regulator, penicillinase repressor
MQNRLKFFLDIYAMVVLLDSTMRPKTTNLTSQQLEIMKVVWRLGTATVRDVYEELRTQRPVAYTTVMTTMKTMEARGHLKKHVDGRAFVYQAVEQQENAIRKIVGDFLDKVFNGSTEPLLAHLVQEKRLSKKDLDKIEKMIRNNK